MAGLKERLFYFIEYKGLTVQSFEKTVGLSNGAVSKMGDNTRRSTIDKISNFFGDLNKNWLLTGEGEMLIGEYPTGNDITIHKRDTGKKVNIKSEYITYLLPMSAMGGSLTGFASPSVFLNDCETIISPIENVDFAITVYGDSMSPEYPSGSRILIKKINPNIFIDWGKTYVLDTPNGVIVKEVHECREKEGYIKCHSINPDPKFSDFDVPLSEVYGMYRVLMCLSAK
ncbi:MULTISPECIES: helix-turn-helix transcriptional regulator [Phocaeicola]|jgi:repressor LexA|nr:S24 family peptidase [Phocaeicola plebeius]